jgi:hypothetical protein
MLSDAHLDSDRIGHQWLFALRAFSLIHLNPLEYRNDAHVRAIDRDSDIELIAVKVSTSG